MRRILSFHGFFLFGLVYGNGFPMDCICAYTPQDSLLREIIRDNLSARQAHVNHYRIEESVKRTNPLHLLSVIDFECLCSLRSDEHVNSACVGTVFQTAVPLFHVIPRLRPGLLSLCSVLASSQSLQIGLLLGKNKLSIEKNSFVV